MAHPYETQPHLFKAYNRGYKAAKIPGIINPYRSSDIRSKAFYQGWLRGKRNEDETYAHKLWEKDVLRILPRKI